MNLKEILTDLGLGDMFVEDTADFSKMTGGRDLNVSAAIHKVFIQVRVQDLCTFFAKFVL